MTTKLVSSKHDDGTCVHPMGESCPANVSAEPKSVSAIEEPTQIFGPCEIGDHDTCAGIAQLRRNQPPTQCGCMCHATESEQKSDEAIEEAQLAPKHLRLWVCSKCLSPRLYGTEGGCYACGCLLHDTGEYHLDSYDPRKDELIEAMAGALRGIREVAQPIIRDPESINTFAQWAAQQAATVLALHDKMKEAKS